MFALALGLGLGLSLSITGLVALVTWSGQVASASSTLGGSSEACEELEDERQRLEALRRELEAERARLAGVRDALLAARTADQEAGESARARRAAQTAALEAASVALDADRERMAAQQARAAAELAAAAADQAERAAAMARESGVDMPLARSSCDLVELEGDALRGRLTDEQRTCVLRLRDDDRTAAQASTLLMVDAFSAGDTARWEALARHHLEVIGEDADVAYKLALHYTKTTNHAESLRFAEMAMSHRAAWKGEAYTARVGSLYGLIYKARLGLEGPDAPATAVAKTAWREFLLAAGKPLPAALK